MKCVGRLQQTSIELTNDTRDQKSYYTTCHRRPDPRAVRFELTILVDAAAS
ncbi:MAG: hypothetical protein ACI93T_003616 [Porticoccaceae bacterium]|jgi:hypothetical protein